MEPLQEVGMGLSSSSGPSGRNLYDCMLRLRAQAQLVQKGNAPFYDFNLYHRIYFSTSLIIIIYSSLFQPMLLSFFLFEFAILNLFKNQALLLLFWYIFARELES